MSASPLVFTYTNPSDAELSNILVNQPTSPLPGVSTIFLYDLQSPNLVLQGATLTGQAYINTTLPKAGETSYLVVQNNTVIASIGTNTIGTLTFVEQFQNPLTTSKDLKAGVSKLSSYISTASGIFANYLFGNVVRVNDNTTGLRTTSIYSAE